MMRRTVATCIGLAVWGCLVAGGFATWEHYAATPGAVGESPANRPASGFAHEIVMFVHPHCPCSQSSLAELAEIARDAGPNVCVRVVFVRPPGAVEGWERGELWDEATALPGVRVNCDSGGAEAHRAGATTAGHVVVYDATGRVVFHGGITRARGRGGDNLGARAVTAVLAGHKPETTQTAVYGCPLFDSGTCNNPTGIDGGSECRQ